MEKLSTLTATSVIEGKNVLIENASEGTTKAGKPFLSLTVRDKSASLPAKLWDYDPTKHGKPTSGDVLTIWAQANEYNGSMQLIIKDLQPSKESPHEYAKSSKFNIEDMWSELVDKITSMEEVLTRAIAEDILLNPVILDALQKAPAAKGMHNAWYGGLLEHMWSLCRIAEPTIAHYQKNYEDRISKDKVIFGLIMHDAGKIMEYNYSTPTFDLSHIGILTNHIVLGAAWVYEKANKWWDKNKEAPLMDKDKFLLERSLLMHIIASHHGMLEWGSPVKPATLEAIIVHQLDMVDSKFMHAWEHINEKKGNIKHFSDRSYIERTPFYNYT